MRIKTKLWMNTGFMVFFLAIIGITGVYYTHHVANVSSVLLEEKALPILQLKSIESSSWEIWSRLIVHTSTSEIEMMENLEQELEAQKQTISQQIEAATAIYTEKLQQEPPQELGQFIQYWQAFSKDGAEALLLSQDFTKEDALAVLIGRGRANFVQGQQILESLVQHHREEMERLRDASAETVKTASWFTGVISSVVILVALLFSATLLNSIINPLNAAVSTAGEIANGNLTARAAQARRHDEIGDLLDAVNQMANSLQQHIRSVREILAEFAKGSRNVAVKGEFLGDFLEIKRALEHTARRLGEAMEENERQAWLKNGQNRLSEQVSGEQETRELTEGIINFLTDYLEAEIGACYLLETNPDDVKQSRLRLSASHAYTWRNQARHEFTLGEGLVGQAAYERKAFVVTDTPHDYLQIESGLGRAKPASILVIPFMYENQLKGVIELATLRDFTPQQLEFLRLVMPHVGIAVNTAESRRQMAELLEQSRAQAEVLQEQAEAMARQKQALEESNERMQEQQEELQQINEELQSQQEELQVQQEELRQTNEELEERSHELETQQHEIKTKNVALEKARAEMEAKAEEVELASRYKSEFLANMSHELRTPLNSLLILAQLLASNKEGNLSEKQIECARTIHVAGADLLNLINDILDLSKVEAGHLEVHMERLSLQNLLESIEQKFRHVAENKGIEFSIEKSDELPDSIRTDAQRLQQVINNLLSNAFKFTERGGVQLRLSRPAPGTALPKNLQTKQTVVIAVQDSGIGIPEEKQQHVFEAFQQADGTTSRKYGGTGLGLSISRQLIQLMGGTIHLESAEGEGSTFFLYLPEMGVSGKNQAAPENADSETNKAHSSDAALPVDRELAQDRALLATAPEMPKPDEVGLPQDDRADLQPGERSLLIIEDDHRFTRLLADLAQERGFKYLLAEDGKTGLDLAQHYLPSAIILDVGLPQADGWTVMERLKENPATRHIPVHFVSGYNHQLDARKMGAIGYSMKPVSMEDLGGAFSKIEHFVDSDMRDLLLVASDAQRRAKILQVIDTQQLQVNTCASLEDALQHLQSQACDCIILDIETEQGHGMKLLERLYSDPRWLQIPVILYGERELDENEKAYLNSYADKLTIKAVRSPERLLDEVTLFLHQVEAALSEQQQDMLRRVLNRESLFAGRRILLVDDDMRNIFALGAILEDKEMEVSIATNGLEAVNALNENPAIDLVLMDIMMPEMDGFTAMREIRKQARFRGLPIIALTAKAMKGDRAKCIEAGANDYLSKPVDTDKLLSLMRVWLYQ